MKTKGWFQPLELVSSRADGEWPETLLHLLEGDPEKKRSQITAALHKGDSRAGSADQFFLRLGLQQWLQCQ